MSETLIFVFTNPQYGNRLFIELQVQYMKNPCSNLGRTCCVQKLFLTFRTIFVHNMFSPCSAKRRAFDLFTCTAINEMDMNKIFLKSPYVCCFCCCLLVGKVQFQPRAHPLLLTHFDHHGLETNCKSWFHRGVELQTLFGIRNSEAALLIV